MASCKTGRTRHYARLDGERSFTHLDASLRISQNDYDGYMDRLEWCLEKLRFFKPDLIEVNNGMDVLKGDPVGHGVLTLDEAGMRDSIVYKFARDNNIPAVTTIAGGYQDDAVAGHVNSFKIAAEIWR